MNDQRPVAAAEVIVLGAGIGGLFAAHALSRAGWRVTVIERSERCGGTHLSRNIGPYTFDVGSIFYEENAHIFRLDPEIRQMCPAVYKVQRRIAPSGDILHYPILPRELLTHLPQRVPLALLDLIFSRLTVKPDGTLEMILRNRLGRTFLKDTGLHNYIARFHHVPPACLDETFFFHRMAFVDRSTKIGALMQAASRALFSNKPVAAKTRRPLRVRPREGFDAMFSRIRQRLQSEGVIFAFGEELQSLGREGARHHVRTSAGSYHADAVVSTVPLESLHQALFGEPSGLVSLGMTTLFVSAAELSPKAGNVLFNFHPEGHWKRATIYSRIYGEAPGGREFFAVEVTIRPGGTHDPLAAMDDFRKHMTKLGIASDLVLEGSEYVEGAYPLYSCGSQEQLQAVLDRIAGTDVLAVGRQGRFEYLPTSSGVSKRVAEELGAAGLLGATAGPVGAGVVA